MGIHGIRHLRGGSSGVVPVGSWDASTSTLALLAALVSHSRTSLATMFDSTGKLTYAPNNLLLNTATLGTQTVTVQVGVNYILSIKGTGSVTLTGASTAGPLNGTGASNRVDLKITAATSSLTLTVAGSVTSARLSAVTYETAFRSQDDVDNTASAYYGPRIDYDPNTLAVKGLLIEEARTNLALQSNDLTTGSYPTSGVSKSTDGTLGPDGKSQMVKALATAAGGSHEIYQSFTVTSGTAYASSIFVKKGNYRYVAISFEVTNGLNGFLTVFDLDNPSAATQSFSTGASTLAAYGIINEGGGIYRIYVAGTAGASGTGYLLAHLVSGATIPTGTVEPTNFVATGTEYAYFFGAQFEVGLFPTSYIPTAAASVTRAADVVQFTGAAAAVLPTNAGTLITEVGGASYGASNLVIVGNAGAYATVVTSGPKFGVSGFRNAGNSLEAAANFVNGSNNRFGVAWGASTYSMSGNGASVTTGSGTTAFSGTPYVGSTGSSLFLNGWVRSFAIYNQRLSDATLQARSVVGASY